MNQAVHVRLGLPLLALFVPNMLKGLSPIRLFIHRSCIYNNRSPYQWKVPIPPIGLVDRPYILRITGSKLYVSIHWLGFGGSQLQMKYLSCGNLSIPPCPRNISFRHPPPTPPPLKGEVIPMGGRIKTFWLRGSWHLTQSFQHFIRSQLCRIEFLSSRLVQSGWVPMGAPQHWGNNQIWPSSWFRSSGCLDRI